MSRRKGRVSSRITSDLDSEVEKNVQAMMDVDDGLFSSLPFLFHLTDSLLQIKLSECLEGLQTLKRRRRRRGPRKM